MPQLPLMGGVVQCGESAGGGGIKEWLLRIVHDEINDTNRMAAVGRESGSCRGRGRGSGSGSG